MNKPNNLCLQDEGFTDELIKVNYKAELAMTVMPDLNRHPGLICAYSLDSGSEAGMTSRLATT